MPKILTSISDIIVLFRAPLIFCGKARNKSPQSSVLPLTNIFRLKHGKFGKINKRSIQNRHNHFNKKSKQSDFRQSLKMTVKSNVREQKTIQKLRNQGGHIIAQPQIRFSGAFFNLVINPNVQMLRDQIREKGRQYNPRRKRE